MKTQSSAFQLHVLRAMHYGPSDGVVLVPPATLRALASRGWIVWHGGQWELTEAGREVAAGKGVGQP